MKIYHKVEYVQRHVCFLNVQSSLHENVVFSVCVRMGNAAYILSSVIRTFLLHMHCAVCNMQCTMQFLENSRML